MGRSFEQGKAMQEVVFDRVIKTTDGARLVAFDEHEVWIPRSISRLTADDIIDLPRWFIDKEDLTDYEV
jgi:hypothetical protein